MAKTDQSIFLEIPISEEYAHLLRLMVAGIASRMNFDLDAVDDLKIAVEEAYLMAINCCFGSSQGINFNVTEDHLEIVFNNLMMSKDSLDENQRKQQDYGLFIIEAVVDELDTILSKDSCDLKLVKYLK